MTVTLQPSVGGNWKSLRSASTRVASLHPLAVFALGTTTGGLLLGLLSGAAAWVLLQADVPLLPAVAAWMIVLLVASEVTGIGRSRLLRAVPGRSQLLPISWMNTKPRSRLAFDWGVLFGAGFFTPLRTTLVYCVCLIPLAMGSPVFAIAAGVAYGATRGLWPLIVSAFSGVARRGRHEAQLYTVAGRLRAPVLAALALSTLMVGSSVTMMI